MNQHQIIAMSHKEIEAILKPLANNIILLRERGSRKQMAADILADYFDSFGANKVSALIRQIFNR